LRLDGTSQLVMALQRPSLSVAWLDARWTLGTDRCRRECAGGDGDHAERREQSVHDLFSFAPNYLLVF
jgi:hypothetical protein